MRGTRYRARIVALALTTAMLAGCAELNSIHRSALFPKNRSGVQFIDAKQRAILSVPAPKTESTTIITGGTTVKTTSPAGRSLICAEPSPDVFAVNAAAASANGSFGQSGTPGNISAALGLSIATSEQAATIGRTQTINLLKEVMYRTCERYLNSGIGPLELAVQAARDQRLIVATLAIEQLTGAIIPKPTVIGAYGETAGGGSAAEAVVRVDDAIKAQTVAGAAKTKADLAYDEANKDDVCVKIAAATDPANPGDALKDSVEPCKAATGAQVSAATRLKAANENLATLKQALNAGGGLVTSASSSVQNVSGSGGLEQANPVNVAAVATAVQAIVLENYAVDEFELLCIKLLDPAAGAGNATLGPSCVGYFVAKMQRAKEQQENLRAKLALETVGYQAALTRITARDLTDYERFWALGAETRAVRITAALKTAGRDKARLESLLKTTDATEAAAIFGKLGDASRSKLLNQ